MLGNRGRIAASKPAGKPTVGAEAAPTVLDSLLVMTVSLLLIWRLMVPPEGSAKGGTLWITFFWPLALSLWGIAQLRAGAWQIRFSRLDTAVWLLVGGHVVAAFRVLATQGDKRSAVNMLSEWVSLGISFFLVRQVIVDRSDRRNLALVLASTAIALSGLGIYQHFYGYRELLREYERLNIDAEKLDRLNEEGPPGDSRARGDWEAERARIMTKLRQHDVPADRRARTMYEQRLRSSEPFGMFALANTFGGLLACLLVLQVGVIVNSWQRGVPAWHWIVAAVLTAAAAYCLLLTKSRTAYVGFAAGLAVWGVALARSRAANTRKLIRWGLGGLAIVCVLGGVAWVTRGLDRFVLSESGKSLRYRLEYWRGTWSVLQESAPNFLLGVGPGNFRQHYLVHKLPESSEEVADPHNVFLDVWANGGMAALAGVVGLCLAAAGLSAARGGIEPANPAQQESPAARKEGAGGGRGGGVDTGVVINGFVLGGGLGFLAAYVAGGASDDRLPLLAAGWGATVAVCSRLFRWSEPTPALFGAAAFALLVHLLGAGGIGMPAIAQTFLTLLALGSAEQAPAAFKSGLNRLTAVAVAGGIVLSLGCLWGAAWPVMSRESWLAQGDAALAERRNADQAAADYARAADADPLSPEPFERQATLAVQRALAAAAGTLPSNDGDAWMEKAVAFQEQAVARDPLNSSPHRAMADWCLEYGRRTKSKKWLSRSAAEYARALSRYPNHAGMNAELALASSLAGDSQQARIAAARALELHDVNVRAGHPDKQLPAERIAILRELAGGNVQE